MKPQTTCRRLILIGIAAAMATVSHPAGLGAESPAPPLIQRTKLAGFEGFARETLWGVAGAPFALANLDRDPYMEIVVKEWRDWRYRTRDRATLRDTQPAKVYAFDHDGKARWTFDQGRGINIGVNFGPVVAFDMDGDGVSEVYCRGADDPHDEWPGFVTKQGDRDWLVKLDPATGRAIARAPWPPHDGFPDSNHLVIGYLDGKRPFLVASAGHESRSQTVRAYDAELRVQWSAKLNGHGAHAPSCADLDGDGKDEVIKGSAVLDDDGSLLWKLDLGHVDLAVATNIDPYTPGLEVFFGSQSAHFTGVVRGKDGKTLWSKEQKTHSQEGCGELDAGLKGLECFGWQNKKDGYAANRINLWSAAGRTLEAENYFRPMPRGKSLTVCGWWRGREMSVFPNASGSTPVPTLVYLIGDFVGDAREEIAWLDRDELVFCRAAGDGGDAGVPRLRQDRKYLAELARGSRYMAQTHYSRPLPADLFALRP